MANEADSRHTTPTVRWGETAAEVPSANVVEPSGGVKDVGWVPGVTASVGEWVNWLWWAGGVMFRYVENVFGLGLVRSHVMAGAAGTEGVVTAGAGLSVDITAVRCWLEGNMYTVPLANDLALAAADPTDDRIDLVVARLVASVPAFAVITGTPAATPVAPDALVGDAAIYTVRVEAAAVVPGTLTDVREFGAIDVDRGIINTRLQAGSHAGIGWRFIFDANGTSLRVVMGDSADPQFVVDANTLNIYIKPEQLVFYAAIARKHDIGPSDFADVSGSSTELIQTGAEASRYGSDAATDQIRAAARIPNGCTITACRAYVFLDSATARGLTLSLYRAVKTTGVLTLLDSVGTSVASGAETLELAGLAEIVDQNEYYVVDINWTAGAGVDVARVFCAEVEYNETRPFNGL